MRAKIWLPIILLAILLVCGCTQSDSKSTPPPSDIPPLGATEAVIETEKGSITIELFVEDAPNTALNFAGLAEDGFYDGLSFHRVIPGFMAQGGCPKGDGTSGPGYTIPCEINKEKHLRGAVSMAHAGRDTGGSQFFICFEDQPHLDGEHTVFGRVVKGMDIVDQIGQGDQMVTVTISPPLAR